MLKSQFELLACYNQAMNGRVYAASAKLSRDTLLENKGAFFSSILGTLNHIVVGGVVWFKRFAESFVNVEALDYVRAIAVPASLSEILSSDLSELGQVRLELDEMIIRFVSGLDFNTSFDPVTYLNMKGEAFSKPFPALLQHVFNHQTHHRGQLTTLLSQEGVDVGVTDVLAFIPCVE